jgi:hypothetical protein
LVGAILAQLYLLLYPHFGREPYRWSERMQAIVAWQQSKTPEAKAAMDAEEARLDRHVRLRFALQAGAFFLVNGLLCYFLWNYGERGQANKGASPNGGPAVRLGNSGVGEGPPSVS